MDFFSTLHILVDFKCYSTTTFNIIIIDSSLVQNLTLFSFRIIISAEEVMERSLHYMDEARRVVSQGPEHTNVQQLSQSAKRVQQVRHLALCLL